MAIVSGKKPIKRWHVLMITFDLTHTIPGDVRYRHADDAMAFHGTLFKPVKQVRFLLTDRSSQTIRRSIEQQTGPITLLITPFRRAYQLSVRGRKRRNEMAAFLAAARKVGLDTSGFEEY